MQWRREWDYRSEKLGAILEKTRGTQMEGFKQTGKGEERKLN